ncbi:hypothetical protein TELCIR_11280, partial [Teladorsagia circumcincta]
MASGRQTTVFFETHDLTMSIYNGKNMTFTSKRPRVNYEASNSGKDNKIMKTASLCLIIILAITLMSASADFWCLFGLVDAICKMSCS